MPYIASWHRDKGYFWPRFGGPKEPWWTGHAFCVPFPKWLGFQLNYILLTGIHRTGQFDLKDGGTGSECWRMIWNQVIGRKDA